MQADLPRTPGREFWTWLGEAMRRMTFLIALILLAGCDPGSMVEPPPPVECASIGQRCQRSDGPIGVCQIRPCPPGATKPCYVCTPQH